MSQVKAQLPLSDAATIAALLCDELRPGCLRIEVAGSVRRRKPLIGDIELVAIARHGQERLTANGWSDNELDAILDQLCVTTRLNWLKGADKYKQFAIVSEWCKLDLFIARPENYGLILTIRTGPADFSRRFVTQRFRGGLLPNECWVTSGQLWRGGVPVETPEERAMWEICGIPWVEPWERV